MSLSCQGGTVRYERARSDEGLTRQQLREQHERAEP